MIVTIEDKLFKDIKSYCSINSLDIEAYINGILKKGFMLEKYGEKPSIGSRKKVTEPINEPKKEPIKIEVSQFPKLKNIEVDFSKQEELKPEVHMPHDIDEDTLEHMLEQNVKQKHRKLTKK